MHRFIWSEDLSEESDVKNFDEADSEDSFGTGPVIIQRSFNHEIEYSLFQDPKTPCSGLFLHPLESPGYGQLNQRLQDIYARFETEIEPAKPGCKKPEKAIEVKPTALSSLMQRRNRSHNITRIRPTANYN